MHYVSFERNDENLLKEVKETTSTTYDVKLCGELISFLLCDISRSPAGTTVGPSGYAKLSLAKCGLKNCNQCATQLVKDLDVLLRKQNEETLTLIQHNMHR